MLAADLAMALDPVRMLQRAGVEPDPWQRRALRSTAAQLLLNCSRQSGKSTVSSGIAVHTALYVPDSLILLLSPALRQSKELFKKCLWLYRQLGRPVPATAETKLELELDNGSRIISLPGNEETIRGFSGARLLIVDEASRVPDEMYYAVRPMLAVSGGRLLAPSTPWGKRGWWHQEWTEGAGWERYEVPATECPRIAPAFLAAERATMGEWRFKQEYLCQFSETEDAVFSYDEIERAVGPVTSPVRPSFFGGTS